MSHVDTELELSDGLTVLVGPNNCGKSAVAVALHVVANNARGGYMLRHGADACVVEVETDEGHVIRWRREKNASVTYTLNGEDIGRLKGRVPDGLHTLLRMPKVDDHDLHFGEQKKPIFLLDASPARRASFFASSSDAAHLVEMQAKNRANLLKANAERKMHQARLDTVIPRRAVLAPVVPLEDEVRGLEQAYQAILAGDADALALEKTLAELDEAEQRLRRVQRASQILEALTSPPDPHDTALLGSLTMQLEAGKRTRDRVERQVEVLEGTPTFPDFQLVEPLEEIQRALTRDREETMRLSREMTTLQTLDAPPPLTDTAELHARINHIIDAQRTRSFQRCAYEAVAMLAPPPAVRETIAIEAMTERLEGAEEAARRTSAIRDVLADLVPPPNPQAIGDLAMLADDLAKAEISCVLADAHLHDETQAFKRSEEAIRAWAIEHDMCPTCGEPIHAERLVAHASHGGLAR